MLNPDQYSASSKYEARLELHKRFRTNPQSKYAWIFDHFPREENVKLLELGCGTGLFWLANRNRIPKSWSITLTDYSAGMLETARMSLDRLLHNFDYELLDAGNIVYQDSCFDVILANNMLYHLDDRKQTLSQIRRILRESGLFVTSTMGRGDLSELHQILYSYLETKGIPFKFKELPFSLENGREQLSPFFPDIRMERQENSLSITEAEPIVAYYLSFNGMHEDRDLLPEELAEDFQNYVQGILDQRSPILARKDSGIFICRK